MTDTPTAPGAISTVLFDWAGVMTSSPWAALTAAGGGSLELLVGDYAADTDHPWHQVERGELAVQDWAIAVTRMGEEQGVTVDFSVLQDLLGDMQVREPFVDRARALRAEGYKVGLLTNNVREGSASWRAKLPVDELFDVVVDSSEVGMRKPNPAIYLHTLELLGVRDPASAVFLDDAPGNVEGARRAGLWGILVDDTDDALDELDRLLRAG
jgi:putative hydrolase of the HAD superfamily